MKNEEILMKIYKGQQRIEEKIKDLQETIKMIPEMQNEIEHISGAVTRIEVEHGEKLQILFDAYKLNDDKIKENNFRFLRNEIRMEKCENEIFKIKKQYLNK